MLTLILGVMPTEHLPSELQRTSLKKEAQQVNEPSGNRPEVQLMKPAKNARYEL